MPKILKKRKLILLFYVLPVIVIIIYFSIALPKNTVIFNQLKSDIPVGEIYGDRRIGQTFVAEHNNMVAIEVLLATYNRKNTGGIIFHLKNDGNHKEDIYSYRLDMEVVQDNEFFRFSFPKIKNSKRKKYYFYFEAPQSKPGNTITIWSNSLDLYKEGEKIVNGVDSEGDLVFKTEYEIGIRLSFHNFLRSLMKFKIFLLNIIQSKVLYFLLLMLVFIWAFIIFAKKIDIFNKKGGFIFLYCILLMIVFAWIFVSFSKKITIFNQQNQNIPVGEIYGDLKIGQTFSAEYNNLSAIEVLLATYNRKNSGEFIFHLKNDVSHKEDLFNYKGDIRKVKDNKYFKFEFPKIKNSKGEKYYFYIEAPQSQLGNAITIWSNSKDLYEDGKKIRNSVPSEGDLVFKTTYNSGLKNNFNTFLENITQNRPFPINKKSFYIILILLFVLSSSLFMTFLAKFFIES